MDYTIEDAVLLHILRKSQIVYPHGVWDKQKRWYPEDDEERPCCKDIYPPSRRYRSTLLQHCKTLKHTATLYNVDYEAAASELRKPHWKAVQKLMKQKRISALQCARYERPTVSDYAPRLLQQACEHPDALNERELKAFCDWIRQYCPEVDTINWEAVCAMRALQRSD